MTKTIYIMISRSTTIASRFIYWLTKKEFTHSSLSILDDLDEMYSFCRIYPRLALPAGLAKESLYRGFYKIHPSIPCRLYKIEVSEKEYEMVKVVLERLLEKRSHFRYDLTGTFDYLLKRERRVYNQRYCSWFIAEILGTFEILSFDKPYSLIEPIDFANHEKTELLFEGNVESLRNYLKECYNDNGKEGEYEENR